MDALHWNPSFTVSISATHRLVTVSCGNLVKEHTVDRDEYAALCDHGSWKAVTEGLHVENRESLETEREIRKPLTFAFADFSAKRNPQVGSAVLAGDDGTAGTAEGKWLSGPVGVDGVYSGLNRAWIKLAEIRADCLAMVDLEPSGFIVAGASFCDHYGCRKHVQPGDFDLVPECFESGPFGIDLCRVDVLISLDISASSCQVNICR